MESIWDLTRRFQLIRTVWYIVVKVCIEIHGDAFALITLIDGTRTVLVYRAIVVLIGWEYMRFVKRERYESVVYYCRVFERTLLWGIKSRNMYIECKLVQYEQLVYDTAWHMSHMYSTYHISYIKRPYTVQKDEVWTTLQGYTNLYSSYIHIIRIHSWTFGKQYVACTLTAWNYHSNKFKKLFIHTSTPNSIHGKTANFHHQ